jgi:pyrrolidone-carboxylate peptidase
VTGFGPFPGAPENPTERLVRALAEVPCRQLGAGALRAEVLPTEYEGSWRVLQELYRSFDPDIVIHFGLSSSAQTIQIERLAHNVVSQSKPDALGSFSPIASLAKDGPAAILSSLAADALCSTLRRSGIAADISDDAGDYVCNSTLYRSLLASPPVRRIAFIHVPPTSLLSRESLLDAGARIIRAATDEHRKSNDLPADGLTLR